MTNQELVKTAIEVRKGIIEGVHAAKAGHPGGSLSATEVFTYLYFEEMNIDPKNPKKADRDRFVLSKGHTAPGLYATLAQRGFFPVEDLKGLRSIGSHLQGHPCVQHTPGIDASSGSLGQGISVATGMALSAKLSNESYRVYTLLGDGEIQEGQVWEAAMFAAAKKLDNLCVIVDNNGLQIDGRIEDVNSPYPIPDKFRAFNFHVVEVADGNDFSLVALYVTDIIQNGSYVIYSSKAKGIMDVAYQTDVNEGFFVPGCVSRKKHIVPLIMGVLEN
jgi:transketolase